jgi:Mg-chelatase subunit ChlD
MMTFLAPALLAGLLAVAIPVVLHLVQREKKQVVAFPSLMFLRKIPYQSVRRRVIRHWPLLLLRAVVIALLALAFARPFLPGADLAAGASGNRDVVILLDRSASMAYGDHFQRAREAARAAVRGLGPNDRASLVLFSADVEVAVQPTAERGTVLAAVEAAAPRPLATRFGPALRAAAGLLESSPMPRREIVLITDFQKAGWGEGEQVKLAPGIGLTPVTVGEPAVENAALVDLAFSREDADQAGGERVTVTARVANRGSSPVEGREIVLEGDGHRLEARTFSAAPGQTSAVSFEPLTLPANGLVRLVARIAPDKLPLDDVFHAVLTSRESLMVLVLGDSSASTYVARALAVSGTPRFDARYVAAAVATPADIDRAAVIVLNDAAPPGGAAGRALDAAVKRGTGLLLVLGERASWPQGAPDLLPGTLGGIADRLETRGGTLGFVDLSHPVFEVFKTARSGDLAAARVFRYRQLTAPGGVLARFDDGGVAVAERRVGQGKVLAWSSSLDAYWNDLVLKPVFVPFLHQAVKYAAGYVPRPSWLIAGDAAGASAIAPRATGPGVRPSGGERVALLPSGKREPVPGGQQNRAFLPGEQGFYEFRSTSDGPDHATVVAVNLDPAESNLATLDPAEFSAAVSASGRAGTTARPAPLLPEDRERRQSIWWYVLALAVLALAAESLLARRLSRPVEPLKVETTS